MIDVLNPLAAILTIAFGAFGFLAPRYTLGALELKEDGSSMGLSEIRASVGCLFVALGLACLITGNAAAYAMMGVAYAGAALGRATSIALDKPPFKKAFILFVIEALLALWLIVANMGSLTI